jgi:hypothetical protein
MQEPTKANAAPNHFCDITHFCPRITPTKKRVERGLIFKRKAIFSRYNAEKREYQTENGS